MSKKQTVVLYPASGAVGHVGPMTQLAKVFLEPPIRSNTSSSSSSFTESLVADNPSISFHVLPPIPPPDFANSTKHPCLLMLELMVQYNEKLEASLRSLLVPGRERRLHSLVVDMFCVNAVDVAAKLGVPVYTFFTSALAVLIQLPDLLAGRRAGLKELGDTPLEFAGSPPMPASHLIEVLGNPEEDELCKTMITVWKRNAETHGVLVNTFEALESRAVEALRRDVDPSWPRIYCIGPLVATTKKMSAWSGSTRSQSAASCSSAGGARAGSRRSKVRLVIESDKGSELRKRAMELRKEADAALQDGGSSQTAFAQFLEDVNKIAH